MSTPNKKLSTRPLKIDTTQEVETSATTEYKPDSSKDVNSKTAHRESDDVQPIEFKELCLESSKLDSSKQDSSVVEYKKVAMRLSGKAVEKLKRFRMETSIPYEILVDVMIMNWEKLPEEIKDAYVREAQQLRGERLIAGQQKTMETMQKRYGD